MVFIGAALLLIGIIASVKWYGLADIGVIVSVIGIFLIIIWAFTPRADAKGNGFPTAGITREMAEAMREHPSVKKSGVAEVADFPDDNVLDVEEDDIDLLARLITAEVGYSTAYDPVDYEEIAYLCGSVVINRIRSDKFPNDLRGVIYQQGQYQCVSNGHISRDYDDIAWEIAEELLAYGTETDAAVVYQAEFPQGSGIYRTIGNQHFCYE